MSYFAERTVSTIDGTGRRQSQEHQYRKFEDFRECDAYVLLGPAGSGKTTEFLREARKTTVGHYVSARNFLTQEDWVNWEGKTLFIDGLDEVRFAGDDIRIPFDEIRNKLKKLGKPQFRLSCREADWLGINDSKHLQDATRNGRVTILRLDPLSLEEVTAALHHNFPEVDPEDFLDQAEIHGIKELLSNPQSLHMLVKVVNKRSDWPKNRMDTFGMACRALIKEHNPEHLIANQDFPVSNSTNIAGRLCAILLLTGSSGFTRRPDSTDKLISMQEVWGKDDLTRSLTVLASKLFEKARDDSFEPMHRQVAEFLGSKYLTSQINQGLPLSRILSLMEYENGSIVSDMRGLGAWLAAHCSTARSEFIARDPIATVLYGDVEGFSIMEKCRVLTNTREKLSENPQTLRTLVNNSRTGDLATKETAPLFQDVLSTRAPSEDLQLYARFLISALSHGSVHPELHSTLWIVVRNSGWRSPVRIAALDLLLSTCLANPATTYESDELLQEVHAGEVEDADDELKGVLLRHFFIRDRSLTEILKFLERPKSPSLFGTYQNFWLHLELDEVSNDELISSLDIIQAKLDAYRSNSSRLALSASLVGRVFLRLLSCLVDRSSWAPIERLIGWLNLARKVQSPGSQHTEQLKNSLRGQGELLKAIVVKQTERALASNDFVQSMHQVDILLLNINYQAAIGSEWFLARARSTADERVAEWYIQRVAGLLHSSEANGDRLSDVKSSLIGTPRLLDSLTTRMFELEETEFQGARLAREYSERKKERQNNWRKAIKAESLSDSSLPVGLLNQLAQVYFGEAIDIEGSSAIERMQDLLGNGTQDLIDKILFGLRTAIHRADVPDSSAILDLRSEQRIHALSLPILAGLQEGAGMSESGELQLSDSQMRTALAIYYSMRLPQNAVRPPPWLTYVLESDPELCADVLVDAVGVRLKAGDECRETCYQLAFSPEYSEVASFAVLPLLRIFPVRCANKLLIALTWLLRAASNHVAADALQTVVQTRLSRKGMNMGQRICWLGAQLLLNQELYRDSFQSYIESGEQRVQHLVQFLSEQDSSTQWIDAMDSPTATMLAGVIGRSYSPIHFDLNTDIYSSDSARASKCVTTLIDKLTFDPSDEVTHLLEGLNDNQELSPWHSRLKIAADTQRMVRQISRFRPLDVRSVVAVLDDAPQASVPHHSRYQSSL